jgi:ketosteroid isomerase-like protein
VPSVELPAELARVLTDYETLYRTAGMKLAELFTEDGFVLSGGRPPIRGRPGIAEYYGRPGGPLSLRALAYATEGNVGYIIGGYTDQKGNPDIGKFTLTLRKGGDGRWLIVSDMDNGNAPPRRQPPG